MSNFSLTQNERLYCQVESTYGIVPNSTGTATVAGTNCMRFIKATLDNKVALIDRPDKTGTLSMQVGVKGRSSGTFSVEASVAPNGTAGVLPDFDPLMQGIFRNTGTILSGSFAITGATNASPIVITATAHTFTNGQMVFISGVTGNTAANGLWSITGVASNVFTLSGSTGNSAFVSGGNASGVGVKYALADFPVTSLSVYSFRTPSTIDQRVAHGAIVTEASFQLGADVATMQISGESQWVLESNQFSVADVTQKGGLSAYPTEPSSPVTNGGIIAGFTGSFIVNGNLLANVRTATVRVQTGAALVRDTFGTYYPNTAESDRRKVGLTFSLYEDDSAAYQNLITVAEAQTPVTCQLVVGTQSGSMLGLTLNNLQLQPPTREEQRRFIGNFPEATAHGSSLTARDELIAWVF